MYKLDLTANGIIFVVHKKKVLAIKRLIGDNLSGLPVPEGIINFLLCLVGDWERVAC